MYNVLIHSSSGEFNEIVYLWPNHRSWRGWRIRIIQYINDIDSMCCHGLRWIVNHADWRK